MASVEIAIRSIFQDDGVKSAEAGLKKLIDKLDIMQLEAAESSESVQHLMTRFMALKDAPVQIKGFKAIEAEIKTLEEQFKMLKKAALAAFAKGRGDAGREFDEEAQQVEKLIQANLRLKTSFNNIGVAARVLTQLDFTSMAQGSINSKQLTKSVEVMKNKMVAAAQEANKMGDVVQLRNVAAGVANLKKFIKELEELDGTSEKTAQRLSGLRKELDSLSASHRESKNSAGQFLQSLNRVGFSLFLIKSSVRTVIGVFEGLFKVLAEGAEQASLFQAFDRAIISTGANLALLEGTLGATSRGLLDQNKMMQATLRLMKAGVPDFEKTAATMAGLAVNAAKVSGELGNVDEIFEKLVKGIVRGSPRLIDDTDVVLKLGDAYERYAEMIGKSADELDEKDQQRAVVSALEEESLRMEELAEAVGSLPSEPFVILENSAKNLTRALSSTVGIIGGELAEGLIDILGIGGQSFDSVADAIKHAEKEAIAFNERLEDTRDIIKDIRTDGLLDKEQQVEAIKGLQDFRDQLSLTEEIQVKLLQGWRVGVDLFMIMADWNIIIVRTLALALSAAGALSQGLLLVIRDMAGPVAEFADAVISKDFSRMKEAGKDVWNEWNDATENAGEHVGDVLVPQLEKILDLVGDSAERFDRIFTFEGKATTIADILEQVVGGLEETGDAAGEFIADLSAVNAVIAELERILGDEAKFLRQSAEVWEKWGAKVREINEDWTEKVGEIHEERLERIKDNWEDFSDAILEINEDLAEDLSELEDSFNDKREKEQKKHQKKKENNEDSHQKKIAAIMRRFEISRLRAIIDRDARALFEAEFRRDEDLKAAEEAAKEKKQDEDERHEEELEDLEEQERKKREKMQAEAAKARAEAEERRVEEAAKIEEWEDEQLVKAADSAIKQRKAAKKAADDRITALRKALDEKQRVEDANQLLEELRQLESIEDAETFQEKIEGIWGDLITFAEENPLIFTMTLPDVPTVPGETPPGDDHPGGPDDTGTGGAPPPEDDPWNGNPPSNGAPCDVSKWGACTEHHSWICQPNAKGSNNGSWKVATSNNISTCWFIVNGGVGQPGIQETGTSSNFASSQVGGGGNTQFAGGGNGSAGTRVVIEARGDNTLERIFKEMAYDAFLEITT